MNFYYPYESPNIRYNFKVTRDQFGNYVPSNFHDESEIVAIKEFEKYMLQMVESFPSNSYTMIELGSNQAYYSLMFHSILRKLGLDPVNILIEGQKENLQRGVEHFNINSFVAESRLYAIGTEEMALEALATGFKDKAAEFCSQYVSNWRTLVEIFNEFGIENLDVLHCDIDLCEGVMFETAREIFEQKRVKYIFLSTHGHVLHEFCLNFLTDCGYSILLNHDSRFAPVGGDTLIIARA
jgi:hypothetical protein